MDEEAEAIVVCAVAPIVSSKTAPDSAPNFVLFMAKIVALFFRAQSLFCH
jgi:hypothetical protein